MKRGLIAVGAVFLVGTSSLALADANGQGVNARQHRQHHRVQQGVRSGELTRREAARLGAEQRAIRAEERRYRADGVLTRGERADLQHDLNRASRDVYRQKHDPQDRPPAAMRDPGVNARQQHERHRIGHGVGSGELTRDEVQALAQEQKSIRREERVYRSDGALTRHERRDLHQDINRASRNIYNEKHDEEKR